MVHQTALIEQEAPDVFDIRCSCGEHTWTPWGMEHAHEIAEMHLWEMLGQGARYLPSGTDPARNAWRDPLRGSKR